MKSDRRPLSPHLQIYKPQITSVLSILHRITGVALAFGALLLAYWLTSTAYGPEAFARAQAIMGSWIGRLVLFGMTFSLFYHLANGIRHLVWDAGHGLDVKSANASAVFVFAFTAAASIAVWVIAGMVGAL